MTTQVEALFVCDSCGERGHFGPYWNGTTADGSIDPCNGDPIPTQRICPWCGGKMLWTGDLWPVD